MSILLVALALSAAPAFAEPSPGPMLLVANVVSCGSDESSADACAVPPDHRSIDDKVEPNTGKKSRGRNYET